MHDFASLFLLLPASAASGATKRDRMQPPGDLNHSSPIPVSLRRFTAKRSHQRRRNEPKTPLGASKSPFLARFQLSFFDGTNPPPGSFAVSSCTPFSPPRQNGTIPMASFPRRDSKETIMNPNKNKHTPTRRSIMGAATAAAATALLKTTP